MTRADAHRLRTAKIEAGLIPSEHTCPEPDCDGVMWLDTEVFASANAEAPDGRVVAVCGTCFYTVEVKAQTARSTPLSAS